MLKKLLLLIFSVQALPAFSQIGGLRSFEFLNIPPSPKIAALAGVNVTSSHGDPNMLFANPALLERSMDNHVSVNYLHYMADIGVSSLSYARNFGENGTFGAGLVYLNYGMIDGYDEAGNETGAFFSNDFALSAGGSHKLGNFTLGSTIKFAGSNLASFKASALLFDMGSVFSHPEKDLTIGMVIKNLGFAIGQYSDNSHLRVPIDIQLGATFKPEHAPIRISVTAFNLLKRNILYSDPESRYTASGSGSGKFDGFLRHFALGTELILNKNVNLRAGYNHFIRKELKLEKYAGLTGFSFGMMFRIKAFEFSYSNQIYHVSGGTHILGITSNLNSFITKAD